jgi:hypothetical protein
MERLEAHRSFFAKLITRDDFKSVQSLQRGTPPDETSWCAGNGWWLSTAPAA